MCGIIGYVGHRPVAEVLLTGLHRLEYRGYDSAGIAIISDGDTVLERAIRENGTSGIDRIAAQLGERGRLAGTGIGHTRWATHGKVTVENAHPHRDCRGRVHVVHNGQVTNDADLRRGLRANTHTLRSETDTELIAHLVEQALVETDDLSTAVRHALERIDGALAIAVISSSQPDRIVCARRGSPLLIGLGEHETVIASDEAAIVGLTKRIVDLADGDVATITADGIHGVQHAERIAEWDVEEAQKGGHPHFTRKEIAEQHDTVGRAINHGGRILHATGDARLGGLERFADRLREIDHIRLVAAGTAHHAALIGRQMLLEIAGVPHVEAECASEVHGTSFHVGPQTAVIAVSQSGETHDTLLAIEEAKRRGALTIGIVNKVATAIPRVTDCGVYCNAGPEIGVASTKAFVSQLTALGLITLFIGRRRGLSEAEGKQIATALFGLPGHVWREIEYAPKLAARAQALSNRRAFFIIGRKWQYPVALEAALKMKELAYVHAEGYPAGELKHGPLAVLSDDAVVLALAPRDETFSDVLLAIQQARKTGATVIGITTPDGERDVHEASGNIPHIVSPTIPMLQPILTIIPLQLFAYELAVALKRDVDKPRHLAKSVTVK
ncbi:MAG: glutamine--fructose-6-phosphate transaminase (isomerizing) [bacterium]|nr:glutamine--fructose-6-phosphate transaminase (isomerizing) [bacterium]